MSDEANKPRLGAGDVTIKLVDDAGELEEYVLKPSYNAARVLSTQNGGIMKTMQLIVDGNIEAAVSIVSLGLGYGTASKRAPKDLAERVWRTGLSDESGGLGERCITYLRTLMAGGRLPSAQTEEGADASEDPTNAS